MLLATVIAAVVYIAYGLDGEGGVLGLINEFFCLTLCLRRRVGGVSGDGGSGGGGEGDRVEDFAGAVRCTRSGAGG